MTTRISDTPDHFACVGYVVPPTERGLPSERRPRLYLNVPFRDREKAKAIKARFDGAAKAWFVTRPDQFESARSQQWLRDSWIPSLVVAGELQLMVSYSPCESCHLRFNKGHLIARGVMSAFRPLSSADTIAKQRQRLVSVLYLPEPIRQALRHVAPHALGAERPCPDTDTAFSTRTAYDLQALSDRGYDALHNRCPGCGHKHWVIESQDLTAGAVEEDVIEKRLAPELGWQMQSRFCRL